MERDMILRVAAKAVVVNEKGGVLVLREASTYDDGTHVGKWGLPGGRLNVGERYEDGLVREVEEETGLVVVPGKPLFVGEWRPVIKGVPHQIIAIFSSCTSSSLDVRLSDEHDAFQWVNGATMNDIDILLPGRNVVEDFLKHNQ